MKTINIFLITLLTVATVLTGCKASRTAKGGAIGAATGGAAGAIIGRASGNTAMGAVIGATVGGAAGAIIGRQMDKQAEEIKKEVPGVKVERVGEGIVIEFKNDVLFDYDRYNLKDDARVNLDNLVQVLSKYPDTNIEIHGHTDSKGSDEYNKGLSERRARTVSNYLTEESVDSKRILIKGYGEEQPVETNATDEGRAKNRRVEFAITANDKMIREAKKE